MLPRIPDPYLPPQKGTREALDPLPFGPLDEDDSARMRHLINEDDSDSPFWKWIFIGGWLVLASYLVLALAGWPGIGLILVPIGIGMIMASGIQLLLSRI
jgi:hypothetical protein